MQKADLRADESSIEISESNRKGPHSSYSWRKKAAKLENW